MHTAEPVQRVRIYLSERDSFEGQPLYLAVLERLQRAGATGATALRGVAGFGAGHLVHTAGLYDQARALPVIIEWIDRSERVGRVLPLLDELLPEALITVEQLRVYRARLRAGGPFGERLIGEVAGRDVVTVKPGTLVADAIRHLLERPQPLLPVLDDQEALVGAFGAGELAQRVGLPVQLQVLRSLHAGEHNAILAGLALHPISQVMTSDRRSLSIDSPIPQAVSAMVEWGLDVLPVIDRAGRFAGIFGVEEALRAALDSRSASQGAVRDAEPPSPVRLLMQTSVPAIAANTPAAEALNRLLVSAERFLVIVDAGRPRGTLNDDELIRRLDEPVRAAWLTALQGGVSAAIGLFEPLLTGQYVIDLPYSPAVTIGALETRDDAIRMLLERGIERLIVVDESGRLAGLIGRRGLLRALAQESSAS